MTNSSSSYREQQLVLVFDTETTGLIKGPRPRALEQYPHITQITAILYSITSKKIVAVLNEYISLPEGIIIEPQACQLNGITEDICKKNGKPIHVVLKTFCELVLSCNVLVAHNYDFDSEIIQMELFRCSVLIPSYFTKMFQSKYLEKIKVVPFCTMKNSAEFCCIKMTNGKNKYPKLIELYRALFGLSPIGEDLHNSAVDTWVCLRCFLKLYYKITIPDIEFSETMKTLVLIKNEEKTFNAISLRTRKNFPL